MMWLSLSIGFSALNVLVIRVGIYLLTCRSFGFVFLEFVPKSLSARFHILPSTVEQINSLIVSLVCSLTSLCRWLIPPKKIVAYDKLRQKKTGKLGTYNP